MQCNAPLQAAQRLQELFGIQLRVLRVQSRSSAHTRGIEAAVGEYVALVDSYTWVPIVAAAAATLPLPHAGLPGASDAPA